MMWMIAILIDKNDVFPKWFGYLNICNAITEFVVAPAWIFKARCIFLERRGRILDRHCVFVVYTAAFIIVLEKNDHP